MTRRFLVRSLLAAAVLCGLLVGSAQAGPVVGWELLGQRSVTDRLDHDVIPVTAAKGNFKSLKIKVFVRAVQFHHVTVHFANGENQTIELRNVIPAGGESRVIDVEGYDRVIRSIELTYDAQSLRGRRARVQVWGRN
ncbi:MAG TPA: hypothetical protein PK413_00745 [Thermoanaerobaculia bacterium]|nr:hypothetical protein [Thermoanaerobaculia bacterium]